MLGELRDRALEKQMSPNVVKRFAYLLVEEYLNFEYEPYLSDCWLDILRLVELCPNCTLEVFQQWLRDLDDPNPYSILNQSLRLRLNLLQSIFEDTFELFLSNTPEDKLKSHIIEEIESLLNKLETNDNVKALKRLQDRFSFLQMTIQRLELKNKDEA